MKNPRIYLYKVTFEEIPDWYWGIHKERKFNDGYLGSPVTHAWKWEFYTPNLQIMEVFPYTDEGWAEACKVECSCIKPDLNNPLCLNENCGGSVSLKILRNTGKQMFQQSKGIHSPESRAKQREMMTGREVSQTTRDLLTEINKGNKHRLGNVQSDVTRQKISESNLGNKSRLGKPHTEETKERMSKAQKGRVFTEEHKKKLTEASKGKKRGPYKTKKHSNDRPI